MTSENLCLTWKDFQATITNSFKTLQKDGDFYDVTLVTEDLKQHKGHKVILSACSEFFKSILKANTHSHPLIFLNGVDSNNIQFILDYIYYGEVSICQDQLDVFLSKAKVLKIEGLVKQPDWKQHYPENNFPPPAMTHNGNDLNEQNVIKKEDEDTSLLSTPKNVSFAPPNETVGISEIEQRIREMTDRVDGVWTCKSCGKTAKRKLHLEWHIESHFEDISFPCSHCDKSFRSKRSLGQHMKIRMGLCYNIQMRHNNEPFFSAREMV